ncbi:MAG: lactate racemase domain-containing protein [Pirellulaceae bacterium]|nr:lactate racemase domain-containing protein [Pirellulaceae bacterium]
MTTTLASGSATSEINSAQLHELIRGALDQLGERSRVLAVVPDATRAGSHAGPVLAELYRYYRSDLRDVLPALGTHRPMNNYEIAQLYAAVPHELFREHRWDFDAIQVGEVSAAFVSEATGGWHQQPWPVELNRLIMAEEHDLIVVVGQVSPHELVGMGGYNQHLFMGTSGKRSLEAAYRIGAFSETPCVLGQVHTALRTVFNHAQEYFLQHLPLLFILTVVDEAVPGGRLRGLVIGDDHDAFLKACGLSQQVNMTHVARPLERVIVDLPADNYTTLWRSNRAIQRTRQALAVGAELVILGSGLKEFGEEPNRDHLIRRFGYRGRERLLELAEQDPELYSEPAVLAHLLHGSSEGQFHVTYCPGKLVRAEIESVGYDYGVAQEWRRRLPSRLPQADWIDLDGEKWYYIADPKRSLWT